MNLLPHFSDFTIGLALGIAVTLLACLLIFFALLWAVDDGNRADRDSDYDDTLPRDDRVDPWQLQRKLMIASDQPMPGHPQMNKGVLLYWALILEEVGELSEAIARSLVWATKDNAEFREAGALILGTAHVASVRSVRLRKMLASLPSLSVSLPRVQAQPILDGTTDIAVVNSGLALSAGLPGAEAYLAVQTSNLSKRNASGRIDKTPDGKWIKGPNYVEPNFDKILHASR